MSSSATGVGMTICFLGAILLILTQKSSQKFGDVLGILYFMTSLYEGLPISVIEAMSLGKAIVASDVLGNKDCVKDGYNGYLLPLKEEVFVEKMNDLIENDEKRKEMEKNSRSYFESDFFIDNRIKALEDLYTEVYNR